jgi:hypothetical protein
MRSPKKGNTDCASANTSDMFFCTVVCKPEGIFYDNTAKVVCYKS